MFRGEQIKNLVDLFEKRDVKLYHSTQYKDFKSYLQLGGIPSRALLSEHQMAMTSFDTDSDDKKNGVWDNVFLNPIDFGNIMKKGNKGIPTVYGPISIEFQPRVLLDANDVAICLRSAGGAGFNRDKESLNTIDEVDRIFLHEYTDSNSDKYLNPLFKSPTGLCSEFNLEYASNPEISLTIDGSLLNFQNKRINIQVDPYIIDSNKLFDLVNREIRKYSYCFEIKERYWKNIMQIMPEIINIISNEPPTPSIDDLLNNNEINDCFRQWIKGIKEKNLEYQWFRFAKYFREGTLLPIFQEIEENTPL